MGFLRTLCGLVAASGYFLSYSASSLSENGSWSLIGITFGATFAWVLLGGRGVKPGTQIATAQPVALVTESTTDEIEEEGTTMQTSRHQLRQKII